MRQEITDIIKEKLNNIEDEHRIKIIFAVESGSRAWGFASEDSDYDVRFIYVHHPEWYLSIIPKRDVIEYPITAEFDYSGWDIRKALNLMGKSNPVLLEWLKSPIVYREREDCVTLLRDMAVKYFSPIASVFHYLHMAGNNYRGYEQGDQVKLKRYFYILRPLFACLWIEKFRSSPPVEFTALMESVAGGGLVSTVYELIERKKSGGELGVGPRINEISEFIREKLEYFTKRASEFETALRQPTDILNEGFRSILKMTQDYRG